MVGEGVVVVTAGQLFVVVWIFLKRLGNFVVVGFVEFCVYFVLGCLVLVVVWGFVVG